MVIVDFKALLAARVWKPIPNCPGRFVLADGDPHLTPSAIATDLDLREFRVAAARDIVAVAAVHGGGLISYKRADGTYVHTLNDHEGFARKLAQLGIEGYKTSQS